MKKVVILGSSGSIGTQTQEILLANPNDFNLVGVSVGENIKKLKETLKNFNTIEYVTVKGFHQYQLLKKEYPHIKFYYGDEGLVSLINDCDCDLIVNALVGFVGFLPTVSAIKKGIDVALANKESLVVGSSLIKKELKTSSSKIFAIDSEHCALRKCLEGKNKEDIKNLVLTASGGSFRNLSVEELKIVTLEDALKHPSWSMGNKITIDSATMMNKGFEIIEAMFLFDFPLERIKVLLHDESIIHSLVEFNDHSFCCDIGPTDMKIAISYALYEYGYRNVDVKDLDFESLNGLHFRKLEKEKYPCLDLAYRAIKLGGSAPCALNGANDVAVEAFLKGKISYLEIAEVIKYCLDNHEVINEPNCEDLVRINSWAKNICEDYIRRKKEC